MSRACEREGCGPVALQPRWRWWAFWRRGARRCCCRRPLTKHEAMAARRAWPPRVDVRLDRFDDAPTLPLPHSLDALLYSLPRELVPSWWCWDCGAPKPSPAPGVPCGWCGHSSTTSTPPEPLEAP